MTQHKTRSKPVLRAPKPKKSLNLSVPPALRLPHDDLIQPEKTSQQTRSRQDQAQTDLKKQHQAQIEPGSDSDSIRQAIASADIFVSNPAAPGSNNQAQPELSSITIDKIKPGADSTKFAEPAPVASISFDSWLIDLLLPTLPVYEQLVLLRLYRHSLAIGRQTSEAISYSRLASQCNLSISSIKRALQGLEARHLIKTTGNQKFHPSAGNCYQLLLDPAQTKPGVISTKLTEPGADRAGSKQGLPEFDQQYHGIRSQALARIIAEVKQAELTDGLNVNFITAVKRACVKAGIAFDQQIYRQLMEPKQS